MTTSIGYSVNTLNDLKAVPDSTVITGYILAVVSLQAWFIYNSSGTDTSDNIYIITPNSGNGRWYRMSQASSVSINNVNIEYPNVSPSVTSSGTPSQLTFNLPRAANISIGTVTTLSAGSNATVTNVGTNGDVVLNIGLPQGNVGSTGSTGSTPTLSIGTVTTLSAGSSATATLVNNGSNSYSLNLGLPIGNTGATPNITIGTVSTLASGSSATASITGITPNLTLNLGIPQGTSGSSSGDPYYSDVSVLCHFDNSNNSTVFTDVLNHIFTTSGSPIISTTQSMFGGSSLYLNGSSYLYINTVDSLLTFGSNDLTFECWIYCTVNPSSLNFSTILSNAYSGAGGDAGLFLSIKNGYIVFRHWYDNSTTAVSASTISANTWYHVAGVKHSSTVLDVFVNGVKGTSGSTTSSIYSGNFSIGLVSNDTTYNTYFNGYIDEVRVTNGYARYTSNFTPATSEFPGNGSATIQVGTVTSLSAGSTPTVTNSGTNSNAIFNFGIPSGASGTAATISVGTVSTLSPGSSATVTNAGTSNAAVFNFGIPQGATGASGSGGSGTTLVSNSIDVLYANTVLIFNGSGSNGSTNIIDTSALDGSTITNSAVTVASTQSAPTGNYLYFNGSAYITVANSSTLQFSTFNYTIEAYVYISSFSTSPCVVALNGYLFQINSSGYMNIYTGTTNYAGNTALALNTLYHIAWVRLSGVTYYFINGNLDYSTSSITGSLSASTLYVGSTGSSSTYTGYMQLRITKSARYASAFSPPGIFYDLYSSLNVSTTTSILTSTTAFSFSVGLSNNANFTSTIALAPKYVLTKVTCGTPVRIRFYLNSTYQTNDLGRVVGTAPTGDVGLLFEGITSNTWNVINLAPLVFGWCSTANIPCTISNLSGATISTLTLVVNYIQLN